MVTTAYMHQLEEGTMCQMTLVPKLMVQQLVQHQTTLRHSLIPEAFFDSYTAAQQLDRALQQCYRP